MHRTALGFLLASVLLISGCARVSTDTKIAADGSFTRTARFVLSQNQMTDQVGTKGSAGLEDTFDLPKSGPGVTVSTEKGKDATTVTAVRTVAAGEPLNDIVIKHKSGQPLLTNSAQVQKMPDGTLEYTESFSYHGKPPSVEGQADSQLRGIVKKSLPERLQVTASIDKATARATLSLMQALFGPPEPIMMDLLTETDVAARKLRAALYKTLADSLPQDVAGMTQEESQTTARAIVNALPANDLATNTAAPLVPTPGADEPNGLTPITLSISFPGKLVRTNGLVDPFSGEVYWSMYAAAASIGPVNLYAVIDPKG